MASHRFIARSPFAPTAVKLTTSTARSTAGPPNYSIFAEEEEAYQKLRTGFAVDVSHPCTLSVARWRDAGLIKPIDTSRIERWNEIPESMLGAAGIRHDGETWFMPFDWGNSTIIYREDELPDAEQSYELLLDPELHGRVSVFDSVDEVFVIAAGILGYETHMDLTGACEQIRNRTKRFSSRPAVCRHASEGWHPIRLFHLQSVPIGRQPALPCR